jgi:hypothetical protein
MPSVCAPSVPNSSSFQQFLELAEVGGHGVPDPWHGDSPEQAARTTEFELDRVREAGSLWYGVQGVGQARGEWPELTLYLQPSGRVVDGDLEALFAPTGNRPHLLVDSPHADRSLGDLAGLEDGVIPLGDVLEVGEESKHLSIGRLIITVFSKMATSRSSQRPLLLVNV